MSSLARGVAVLLAAIAAALALLPGAASAADTTVPMGGNVYGPFWFCSPSYSGSACTTTINAGDTVTWYNSSAVYHTATECDGNCGNPNPPSPLWDSGAIPPNGTYQRQFNQVGSFNYQCNIHPHEMKGQIVVQQAAPTPTATSTVPTVPPSPTPTPPSVGGVSFDPTGSASAPSTAAKLIVAAAFVTGSFAWFARKRTR